MHNHSHHHHEHHCGDHCDDKECKCARTYTLKSISSLISHVDYEIWKISVLNINELKYGYKKQSDQDYLISNLTLFKFVLQNKIESLHYNYKFCLCDCKIQKIIEKYKLSKKPRIDKSILVDKSNLEVWTLNNKNCVSKEKWEECACDYIQNLGLDISVVENIDKLLFDIEIQPIFKDLLIEITSSIKNKDLFFDASANENRIKLEFDRLVSETKSIISFDEYYTLRNKGITFDTVRTCYSNDISFTQSVNSNETYICTKTCNYIIP